MAESERPQDDTEPTEEDEQADGNGADEPDLKPPFSKGWRWPLIILVVGIIAMGALVTLFTQPEEPLAPPPPPPPPPGVVVPRV
jgi:hypothetical protein